MGPFLAILGLGIFLNALLWVIQLLWVSKASRESWEAQWVLTVLAILSFLLLAWVVG